MTDTDPTKPIEPDGYLASLIGGPMDMRVMFVPTLPPELQFLIVGDHLAKYELTGTEQLDATVDTRAVNLATYQYVGPATYRVSSIEGPANDRHRPD